MLKLDNVYVDIDSKATIFASSAEVIPDGNLTTIKLFNCWYISSNINTFKDGLITEEVYTVNTHRFIVSIERIRTNCSIVVKPHSR